MNKAVIKNKKVISNTYNYKLENSCNSSSTIIERDLEKLKSDSSSSK